MLSINEWVDLVVSESEFLQNIVLNQSLDDSFGLGGSLKTLAQMDSSERPTGVLLTGADGTGKHNAASHILQALDRLEKESFVPVFLQGYLLAEKGVAYPMVSERLSMLLDHFRERKQSLCLVLDEPEECPCCRQLYLFLGAAAQKKRIFGSDGEQELFLILIARRHPSLPSLLQEELLTIVFDLPTLAQRKTFLDRRGKTIRRDVSLEQLAVMTEGCSYTTLGQVINRIQLFIDSFDAAPNDEVLLHLISQLREQASQEKENPVVQSINSLRSAMEEIIGKLSDLARAANSLPVNNTRANNSRYDIHMGQQTSSSSDPLNPSMEDIEKMSIFELGAEMLGEEFNKNFLL